MFGWSPQRAEIQDKEYDVEVLDCALSELSKSASEASNLKSDLTSLSTQIQLTYRVSGGSGKSLLATKIKEEVDSTKTKLKAARTDLKNEIKALKGQEEAYFENQRRLREQAEKEYEESLTRSNPYY